MGKLLHKLVNGMVPSWFTKVKTSDNSPRKLLPFFRGSHASSKKSFPISGQTNTELMSLLDQNGYYSSNDEDTEPGTKSKVYSSIAPNSSPASIINSSTKTKEDPKEDAIRHVTAHSSNSASTSTITSRKEDPKNSLRRCRKGHGTPNKTQEEPHRDKADSKKGKLHQHRHEKHVHNALASLHVNKSGAKSRNPETNADAEQIKCEIHHQNHEGRHEDLHRNHYNNVVAPDDIHSHHNRSHPEHDEENHGDCGQVTNSHQHHHNRSHPDHAEENHSGRDSQNPCLVQSSKRKSQCDPTEEDGSPRHGRRHAGMVNMIPLKRRKLVAATSELPERVCSIVGNGSALVKYSEDPYLAFWESMVEMIVGNGLRDMGNLEFLLYCYLRLNEPHLHETIHKSFLRALEDLQRTSPFHKTSSLGQIST